MIPSQLLTITGRHLLKVLLLLLVSLGGYPSGGIPIDTYLWKTDEHTVYQFPNTMKMERSHLLFSSGDHSYIYNSAKHQLHPITKVTEASNRLTVMTDTQVHQAIPSFEPRTGFRIDVYDESNHTEGPFMEYPIGEFLDFAYVEGAYYLVVINAEDWRPYVLQIEGDEIRQEKELEGDVSAPHLDGSFVTLSGNLYVHARGHYMAMVSGPQIEYFYFRDNLEYDRSSIVRFLSDEIAVISGATLYLLDPKLSVRNAYEIEKRMLCEECRIDVLRSERHVVVLMGSQMAVWPESRDDQVIVPLDFVPNASAAGPEDIYLVHHKDIYVYNLEARTISRFYEHDEYIVGIHEADGNVVFVDDRNNGIVIKPRRQD